MNRFSWLFKNPGAFRLSDNNFNSLPQSFYLQADSFVVEKFDDFILLCHEHGFINYVKSKWIFNSVKNHADDPPQVLDLFKLSAGFTIWIVSVFIACCVFIFEILTPSVLNFYKIYSEAMKKKQSSKTKEQIHTHRKKKKQRKKMLQNQTKMRHNKKRNKNVVFAKKRLTRVRGRES